MPLNRAGTLALVFCQLAAGVGVALVGGLRAGGGINLIIAALSVLAASTWALGHGAGAGFLLSSAGMAFGLLVCGDPTATGTFLPMWAVAVWITLASAAGIASIRLAKSLTGTAVGSCAAMIATLATTAVRFGQRDDWERWLPLATAFASSCLAVAAARRVIRHARSQTAQV